MIDTNALAAAAASAHAVSLSGHLLGELGASGAAAVSTAVLVAGIKGTEKIKLKGQQRIAGMGLLTGTFYGAAVGIWTTPATMTAAIEGSFQGTTFGSITPAAFAALLCVLAYGFRLNRWVAAGVGVAAASTFAAAGGIWAIGSTTVSAALLHLVGA